MERMTDHMVGGGIYVKSETGTEGTGAATTQRRLPEIIRRLCEYEDTGLTPKQINGLRAGALRSDKTMHKAYNTALARRHYGATCPRCGGLLSVAYHEDRLYSVKCESCEILTLVEARNPCDAQYKAGGIRKERPVTMEELACGNV